MLKIWSMKQQQQKNEAASGQTKKKKVTAAQLRVQKGESHTYIHTYILDDSRTASNQPVQNRTPLTRKPKNNRPLRTLPPQHDENHLPGPR